MNKSVAIMRMDQILPVVNTLIKSFIRFESGFLRLITLPKTIIRLKKKTLLLFLIRTVFLVIISNIVRLLFSNLSFLNK